MPEMPAFCQNCRTIFGSGMVFENCKNITLIGFSIECPKCGKMGQVPDGVYDIVGNIITVLTSTKNTVYNLNKLNNILTNAKKSNYSHEEIKSKIKEELPELSSLSDTLPKTRNELYAFIVLILTTIGLTLAFISSTNKNEISESKIKKITEKAIEKSLFKHNTKKYKNDVSPQKNKTGRNEPCPCGSGKKFKKCCIHYIFKS